MVLLDLTMPGISGHETLRRLREFALALASLWHNESVWRGRVAGASGRSRGIAA
jgi:hypothetical protein